MPQTLKNLELDQVKAVDISIIIVSWNVSDLLDKCLYSIYDNPCKYSYEVIVVDNNSGDLTTKMVAEKHQKTMLIDNRLNLGFAKATNQGILKSAGKYILLLNPDTLLLKDSLNNMVDFMEANETCGILGPQLLNTDQTIQPSCRRFPTIYTFLMESSFLNNFYEPEIIKNYLMKDFDFKIKIEVDQVMGACFMIRKELTDKIGLFDERFFIFFEEVDFCFRAKSAGWKIFFLPSAQIIHHLGASMKQRRSISLKYFASRLSFAQMHFKKHTAAVSLLRLFYSSEILLYGNSDNIIDIVDKLSVFFIIFMSYYYFRLLNFSIIAISYLLLRSILKYKSLKIKLIDQISSSYLALSIVALQGLNIALRIFVYYFMIRMILNAIIYGTAILGGANDFSDKGA